MGCQHRHHQHPGKKIRATTREPNGAIFMLRCAELGLDTDALAGMDIGMVYDLCIEQGNDQIKYPYKATQADINAFFGGDPNGRPN